MDLRAAIEALRAELKRIDATIAALEVLQKEAGVDASKVKPRSKLGRKGMSAEERQEVAERMRRYWAKRRGKQDKDG